MKPQINAVQESIKIALDAADAATDVTAEYKRIKNEYIKTEKKMKEIHKYTTIIFSSSIATAIVAILLTGLLYFKSLSELEEMTDTSREALVVFAENVENVNKAVENMNSSLSKHTDLLNANEDLKLKMNELSEAILNNDKKLMINLSKEISNEQFRSYYLMAYRKRGDLKFAIGNLKGACNDFKKAIFYGDYEKKIYLKSQEGAWCKNIPD